MIAPLRLRAAGLALSLSLLLDPVPLRAQEGLHAPSSVERKNRAPVSPEILKVKLPRPFEAKLKNGMTVLILEDGRAPFVTVQLYLRGAGSLFEPPESAGLAHATASMLTEGTASRTSVQLAEEIDRLGAGISAGAAFGSPDAVVSASGLSDNFDAWFGVLTDVLLNPVFPETELEKLKQRQRARLREQRSSSGFLLSERFNRVVYGEHPAGQISATPESIDKLTRSGLLEWHRRYTPQNAILGVAGDVRAKELLVKLEKRLGGWKSESVKQAWPEPPRPADARRVLLIDRPGSVQTNLALGNIAIDRRSPDFFAMAIMNHLLGGGASSRLFLNLREEKGYTYGVYSGFTALQYPGPWHAGGSMRTEVTAAALDEFFHEIRRIREHRVAAEELEAGKRAIVASFALSLEQPARVLGFAITAKQYNFPPDYWDSYPAKIMAVSAEDVQRVARAYLDPGALQLVAVGDAGRIESALAKYGVVEIFDAAGKPRSRSAP